MQASGTLRFFHHPHLLRSKVSLQAPIPTRTQALPARPPSRSSEELSRVLGLCMLSISRLGVKTWHPSLKKPQPNLGE